MISICDMKKICEGEVNDNLDVCVRRMNHWFQVVLAPSRSGHKLKVDSAPFEIKYF
jgi:hypothetical protein